MATTFLNTKIVEVENKWPDAIGPATTAVPNGKVGEVENKTPSHDKYITSPEFNELTAENFTAKLKQANWKTKTDFDNKLTSFNRNIISN